MNYEILNTGSKGNCIILNSDFILDCGVPYKMVKPYLKDIKCIFISHSHGDHLKMSTIKKIAFEHPNIKFIVGRDLVTILSVNDIPKKNIYCLELGKFYKVGNYQLKLDFLYHDVPNYCIHIYKYNDEINMWFRMIYATDTTKIDHINAKDYDFALIEANYDTDEELDKKILEYEKRGEFTHLKRVKETHLSQLKALNWLQKNNITNYQFIHQHIEKEEENENTSNIEG